jgi:hypothetical protein
MSSHLIHSIWLDRSTVQSRPKTTNNYNDYIDRLPRQKRYEREKLDGFALKAIGVGRIFIDMPQTNKT